MRLNETELGECCRRKGLYIEQVPAWRGACEQAEAAGLLLAKKSSASWGKDEDD